MAEVAVQAAETQKVLVRRIPIRRQASRRCLASRDNDDVVGDYSCGEAVAAAAGADNGLGGSLGSSVVSSGC